MHAILLHAMLHIACKMQSYTYQDIDIATNTHRQIDKQTDRQTDR